MTSVDLAFELNNRNFCRIAHLIRARAGIDLAANKQAMVHARLTRRLRQCGVTGFDEYIALLERGDNAEWQEFTNALTTNLTAFFREAHHFEFLARELARGNAPRRTALPVRIWSAACSTGEEPYSIAMTAAEVFGSLKAPLRILASDIDTAVLDRAKRGIYSAAALAPLSAVRRKQFFVKQDDDTAQVRRELRDLVVFRHFNLLDDRAPSHGLFDAIFCRNVLIYFDAQTKRNILRRFARVLRPDGLLFTGHAETLLRSQDLFEPCDTTVYRRVANAGLDEVTSAVAPRAPARPARAARSSPMAISEFDR